MQIIDSFSFIYLLSLPVIIGFITGIVICIPVGPINVWVVHSCIKKNKASATLLALGAALMDVFYFLVILFGSNLLEKKYLSWINLTLNVELIKRIFYFLGVGIILVLGIKELLTKKIEFHDETTMDQKWTGSIGAFFFGIFLYVSNPTLFVTMSAIAGFLKTLPLLTHSFELYPNFSIVILSLSLGMGTFFWFYSLIILTQKYQTTIREKYLLKFTKVSGGLMVLLALILILKS